MDIKEFCDSKREESDLIIIECDNDIKIIQAFQQVVKSGVENGKIKKETHVDITNFLISSLQDILKNRNIQNGKKEMLEEIQKKYVK